MPVFEEVVAVVDPDDVHAADDPRIEEHRDAEAAAHLHVAVHAVRAVLPGLAHVLGIVVVPGDEKDAFVLHDLPRALHVRNGHEVDEVPRVHEKIAVLLRVGDLLLQIPLFGRVSHPAGQSALPLVVPLVREIEVGVGDVQQLGGIHVDSLALSDVT